MTPHPKSSFALSTDRQIAIGYKPILPKTDNQTGVSMEHAILADHSLLSSNTSYFAWREITILRQAQTVRELRLGDGYSDGTHCKA